MPAATDYNLGLEPKKGGGADSGIPASDSSNSGLSSDFYYGQQLSPAHDGDRPNSRWRAGGNSSVCSSVDIDRISSPETISPSSPCSDTFDDVTITKEKFKPGSTNSSTAAPACSSSPSPSRT